MGKELDYEICIPCVVRWCTLWFSAPTRLNQALGRDLKIKRYDEAVDKENAEAISGPFFVFSHPVNVHVGLGGLGFVRKTQEMWSG